MNTFADLSPSALRKAADIQEKILELQVELTQILGGSLPVEATTPLAVPTTKSAKIRRKRRQLSVQGLANIRAGAAKRKAARQKQMGSPEKPNKPKSGAMSPANQARSEAMKARWAAKRKAQG